MKFAVLFEESDVSYFKLQVPIMALRPALYLIHTNHPTQQARAMKLEYEPDSYRTHSQSSPK